MPNRNLPWSWSELMAPKVITLFLKWRKDPRNVTSSWSWWVTSWHWHTSVAKCIEVNEWGDVITHHFPRVTFFTLGGLWKPISPQLLKILGKGHRIGVALVLHYICLGLEPGLQSKYNPLPNTCKSNLVPFLYYHQIFTQYSPFTS